MVCREADVVGVMEGGWSEAVVESDVCGSGGGCDEAVVERRWWWWFGCGWWLRRS